jgi:hypothetical protein
VGFALLVLLLVAAGLFGWATISGMSREVSDRFAHANELTRQSSTFSHTITEEVQAATSYLANRDAESEANFRKLGWEAHRMHRTISTRRSERAGEVTSTVAVDSKLAQVENAYAIAHRLADLGRLQEANAQAQNAVGMVGQLLDEVRRTDNANNVAFANAATALRENAL